MIGQSHLERLVQAQDQLRASQAVERQVPVEVAVEPDWRRAPQVGVQLPDQVSHDRQEFGRYLLVHLGGRVDGRAFTPLLSQPTALCRLTPSPPGKQLRQLVQRSRVQNVFGLEPPAPCLAYPVLHELETIDRVCIRSEGNLHAHVLRQSAKVIIDVEPCGMRVELDAASPLLGGLQDPLEVDSIRASFPSNRPVG